jgi:ApbE superfamily uncharacterized protein (UPF0280 family)
MINRRDITMPAIDKNKDRFYRGWCEGGDLVSFNVKVKESDLYIRANKNLSRKALRSVSKYRSMLERYIQRNPEFATSLEPLLIGDDAPLIAREMAKASRKAGVGPMSAVAGAIAEFVGRDLLDYSDELIVENGGDIFIKTLKSRRIGIYAGDSYFSGKIALEVEPEKTPLGICTSSASVGHSLSLGGTDAAVVIASSAILADAAATAIGNLVKEKQDIDKGIHLAKSVTGIKGVLIIKGDNMGIWGDIRIRKN